MYANKSYLIDVDAQKTLLTPPDSKSWDIGPTLFDRNNS